MLIKVDTHSYRYAAKTCIYIFSTENKITKNLLSTERVKL